MELDKNNIVIQVNGKKRAILNIKRDINENELLRLAKENNIVEKYLNKKEVKKIIFIKNRLMNILTND